MRITVVGAGNVGLVSAACFAEFGNRVYCVDNSEARNSALRTGELPIYEPGLETLVARNLAPKRLQFTTDLENSVKNSDVVFITVGTPARRTSNEPELRFVFQAAIEVAQYVSSYTVVATKSTVPVGTAREIERAMRAAQPDAQFDLVSNPEFLREGSAIEDFMRPDRIVVGSKNERSAKIMDALYRPLKLNRTPVMHTTLETAELIKYATNAFLATKITFINQLSDLCEQSNADVQDVARGMGLDGRIGEKYLHPGPGYGGSCFPKDTNALAHMGRQAGTPVTIVESVISANEARKQAMANRICSIVSPLEGKRLAILGLTFKPNTDDMRDSPALTIVPELIRRGASVFAYDPAGMNGASKLIEGMQMCGDCYGTLDRADALIIMTEWNEFRALSLGRVREAMATPLIIDLRNIYNASEVKAAGFTYHGVGLGVRKP